MVGGRDVELLAGADVFAPNAISTLFDAVPENVNSKEYSRDPCAETATFVTTSVSGHSTGGSTGRMSVAEATDTAKKPIQKSFVFIGGI